MLRMKSHRFNVTALMRVLGRLDLLLEVHRGFHNNLQSHQIQVLPKKMIQIPLQIHKMIMVRLFVHLDWQISYVKHLDNVTIIWRQRVLWLLICRHPVQGYNAISILIGHNTATLWFS